MASHRAGMATWKLLPSPGTLSIQILAAVLLHDAARDVQSELHAGKTAIVNIPRSVTARVALWDADKRCLHIDGSQLPATLADAARQPAEVLKLIDPAHVRPVRG